MTWHERKMRWMIMRQMIMKKGRRVRMGQEKKIWKWDEGRKELREGRRRK